MLTGLGVDPGHIASSRTLDFADAFHDATDGQGMDVVLNSLAGDFVDASLQLLPRGGSFIEIGKTDIRAAGDIAASHPGVAYQAYDLATATAESLQRAWTALTQMFADGALTPLPTTSYGLLNAPQAFRDMSQARHTGKIVLIPPAVLDPEGTVLITGGTGMLGTLVAEHLVTHYAIKHLLLLSRRGPDAPGAGELQQHLSGLGAKAAITACDTADPAELAAALDTIAADHPLTAVLHTAGVLDDAVIAELSPQQLDAVLAAKADAAWHLHRLTAERDLAAFVLFSSAAGIMGSPGQANYAAANAFLDALARHRHHTQRPATSVAWGYWQTPTGMTAHLTTTDLTRLTGTGLIPITSERGLALFDAALASQRTNLLASPLQHRRVDPPRTQQHVGPDPIRPDHQPPPSRHRHPPHPGRPIGHPNPPTTAGHPHRNGHRHHRRRAGPPRPGRPRPRPPLQRPRHRLTDRPGTTQHPQPTHRPDPAGNPGLRPPHPHRTSPPPRHPTQRGYAGIHNQRLRPTDSRIDYVDSGQSTRRGRHIRASQETRVERLSRR